MEKLNYSSPSPSYKWNVRIVRHAEAGGFLGVAGSWLTRAEAENNLMLGVAGDLRARPGSTMDPYLAIVEEAGNVVAAAVQTPPHGLILTRAAPDAIGVLLEDFLQRGIAAPAVIAPAGAAQAFADAWAARTGGSTRVSMRQGIYQLTTVRAREDAPPGQLRLAREDELELLTEWALGFAHDVAAPPEDREAYLRTVARRLRDRSRVDHLVRDGGLYLWEHQGPASMAAAATPTPHGIRINFVYTPPERRGRGYASACVAGVSQAMLDAGHAFCFLYTDLANPTSNAIYRRIGYEPVVESAFVELIPPAKASGS